MIFTFLGDEIHCKGHRPSQFIWQGALCDGHLDCIDRSDEAGCDDENSSDAEDFDLLVILSSWSWYKFKIDVFYNRLSKMPLSACISDFL